MRLADVFGSSVVAGMAISWTMDDR